MLYYFLITKPALRGEAAFRSRLPKEGRKIASVSPYDRLMAQNHWATAFNSHMEEQELPCVGELLQFTRKGAALFLYKVHFLLHPDSQIEMSNNRLSIGFKTEQVLLNETDIFEHLSLLITQLSQ